MIPAVTDTRCIKTIEGQLAADADFPASRPERRILVVRGCRHMAALAQWRTFRSPHVLPPIRQPFISAIGGFQGRQFGR